MTSHSLRNKAPLVLPPEKGSFPLDREQACSEKGGIYRTCLREHNNSSSICRQKARDYFECRMDQFEPPPHLSPSIISKLEFNLIARFPDFVVA
jgi:hypothetical protein